MEMLIVAVALVVALLPPAPYAPPNLSDCSLAHGFVIGEAPDFRGSIEIWNCAGKTVVTLNQIRGLPPDTTGPLTRSHFSPETGPGEHLMGCRGSQENFDGTVAVTGGADDADPKVRRAWQADTEKWAFVPSLRTDLVCKRGLTVQ
jgi:hypothetical protein